MPHNLCEQIDYEEIVKYFEAYPEEVKSGLYVSTTNSESRRQRVKQSNKLQWVHLQIRQQHLQLSYHITN